MAQTDKLLSLYSDLLTLCDALEVVADNLPRPPAIGRCHKLAEDLGGTLAAAHHQENLVLFPMLSSSGRPELIASAARLRREQDSDKLAAFEIGEMLLTISAQGVVAEPEAKGYMLRSFFESVRRHVHAERDMISLLTQHHIADSA